MYEIFEQNIVMKLMSLFPFDSFHIVEKHFPFILQSLIAFTASLTFAGLNEPLHSRLFDTCHKRQDDPPPSMQRSSFVVSYSFLTKSRARKIT